MTSRYFAIPVSGLALALCLMPACGDSTITRDLSGLFGGPDGGLDGGDGGVNGAVAGPLDSHCALADGGAIVQETSEASCHPADAGTAQTEGYPATMYNAEGNDDDCKYHVKWSATPVAINTDVTFTVVADKLVDSSWLTGADPQIEAFLSDTHPAPNSGAKTAEVGPGTYTVGPIRFDASGRWTVRFHFFEDCADSDEASPHGHAAFYVDVP